MVRAVEFLTEAAYPGNIGMMELVKFYQQSSKEQKDLLKKLIDSGDKSKAWQLVQQVTGVKLQGAEFATEQELEEGWKDWVAGTAMALGALGAQAGDIVTQIANPGDTVYKIARDNGVHPSVIMKLNGFNNQTKLTPGQEVKVPDVYTKDAKTAPKAQAPKAQAPKAQAPAPKAAPKAADKKVVTVTENPLEKVVLAAAIKNGITGTELAAFMAQVAHESHDFKSMVEYGGSLDFRKYDPKYAPRKAKTLGNTKPGDGAKYKGRGFIQITGKYNYKKAGEAIGVDLVNNPKLAEDPAVAAKIAVWYWKLRVQPNVDNWNDIRDVTKPINPGLRGLEDRQENFQEYLAAMAPSTDKIAKV
jgi:predicted chitinase